LEQVDEEEDNGEVAMDDSISRESAISVFTEWQGKEFGYIDLNSGERFINAIESLPSVEPKTGRWIPVDSFSAYGGDEVAWEAHGNPIAFYYCSECKEHAYAGEDGESLLTDFCPHCGAKMEGGKE
jgi:hypothetical protein